MPKKDVWSSHYIPGTVRIEGDPPKLLFDTRLDSPETYNGRNMKGRIITVAFGHPITIQALIDEFVTVLREMGNQLPETMG